MPGPGRPSKFTQALADNICTQITEGKSLRAICSQEEIPCISTVIRWLRENKDFQSQYTQAKDDQADTLADEILHIADNTKPGVITKTFADGSVETREQDMTEHRKLQIDARKWIAARLKPKKYGDKVEHVGDAAQPIAISVNASKW